MTTNILLLAAALLILMLVGVPVWVYALIVLAGIAPAAVDFWRSLPQQRLAVRARHVAERVRTSRMSARGRKLNGSAC